MAKNSNIAKITAAVFAVVFIVGMVFATLYDFEISAFLTKMKETDVDITMSFPIPSLVIEIIGEWPATVLGAFCAAVILRGLLKFKKTGTYVGAGVMAVLIFYIMYSSCENTIEDVHFLASSDRSFGGNDIIIAIVATIITSLAIIAFALMMSQKTADRLFVPAIVCAAMLLCLLVGVNVLKAFWGRVRMRELFELGDFSGFTKWYVPNLLSGSKSFPSGHTANAVALGLVPLLYSKKQKRLMPYLPMLTYILVGVWSVLVAFSRITVGAHYLSDVLMGAALAFIAVMLGHYFMKKIREAVV